MTRTEIAARCPSGLLIGAATIERATDIALQWADALIEKERITALAKIQVGPPAAAPTPLRGDGADVRGVAGEGPAPALPPAAETYHTGCMSGGDSPCGWPAELDPTTGGHFCAQHIRVQPVSIRAEWTRRFKQAFPAQAVLALRKIRESVAKEGA